MEGGSDLARALKFDRPEKFNRLLRDPDARPSYDIINDIIQAFPKYSPEWIISGRGPKFRQQPDNFTVVGDRIGRICEVYNIDIGALAEKTNNHPAFIHELINNANMGISRDFFVQLLEAFPDLSPKWLAYNEGPMRRSVGSNLEVTAGAGDTIIIHLK